MRIYASDTRKRKNDTKRKVFTQKRINEKNTLYNGRESGGKVC